MQISGLRLLLYRRLTHAGATPGEYLKDKNTERGTPMSKRTVGIGSTAAKGNQGSVVQDALSAERHPVDSFTISPRLYSGEDREFGRVANPSGTITIDAAGAFTPQRVSWTAGEKQSEIYVAAFIPAQRWNGWAKPYFSQSECLRLALTQSAFDDSLKFEYDPVRELWQEFNDEEDYREDCPTMVIGGEICHQIGSGFTWMELPNEPQHLEPGMPRVVVREVRSVPSATKRRSTPVPPEEQASSLAIPGTLDTGYGPSSP